MKSIIKLIIGSTLAIMLATNSTAADIDFSSLSGPDGAPFVAYNQSNIWVTSLVGSVCINTRKGAPAPSIGVDPICGGIGSGGGGYGTIELHTNELLYFRFAGFDFASLGTVRFEGYGFFNGSKVYDFGVFSGGSGDGNFHIWTNNSADVLIDKLYLHFEANDAPGSFLAIDNISVSTPVPEPRKLDLFIFGALAMGVARILRKTENGHSI